MYKTCRVAVRGQKKSQPKKPQLACPHWSLRLVYLHGVWVRLASSCVLAHIHSLIWWELCWGELFSPAAVFFTWKISSWQSGWLRLQLARIIWYQTFGMQRNKNWLFPRLPSFTYKKSSFSAVNLWRKVTLSALTAQVLAWQCWWSLPD